MSNLFLDQIKERRQNALNLLSSLSEASVDFLSLVVNEEIKCNPLYRLRKDPAKQVQVKKELTNAGIGLYKCKYDRIWAIEDLTGELDIPAIYTTLKETVLEYNAYYSFKMVKNEFFLSSGRGAWREMNAQTVLNHMDKIRKCATDKRLLNAFLTYNGETVQLLSGEEKTFTVNVLNPYCFEVVLLDKVDPYAHLESGQQIELF